MPFTRALLVILVLGILLAPLAADAQLAGKVYRVGYLSPISPPVGVDINREAFLQGLRDLGWVEGQNLIIEWRWAEGKLERLPDLASELVRLKPDVILTMSSPGARAAQNAARTIPIVFLFVGDSVELGLVASLARPGGNITGLESAFPEMAGKWLELLKETIPRLSRVAFLWDGTNPAIARAFKQAQLAAQTLGLTLQSVLVRDPNEFEPAFSAMSKERVEALVEFGGAVTVVHRRRIADLALKNQLPTMFWDSRYVHAGGLMSYAAQSPPMFRRAASFVDKILKGAKPADLPVERPMKFELVINMKTAKALGLTIPQSVLIRADKIIE